MNPPGRDRRAVQFLHSVIERLLHFAEAVDGVVSRPAAVFRSAIFQATRAPDRAQRQVRSRRLPRIRPEISIQRTFWLAVHQDGIAQHRVRCLVDWLVEVAEANRLLFRG